MAERKLLTASIIAKNEEEMIGTMLDSIRGCDEIMIVDTGSTDNTVKIAKEKGAKVFRGYKWADDFAEARNVAKDKAKGEWLLIIDCDEIFNQDIERLKEFILSDEMKGKDAAFFSVDTGAELNDQIRLFRNRDDIEWFGEFHNLPYMVTDNGHERIPDDRIYKSTFSIKANYSPNHDRDPNRTLRIIYKVLKNDPNNTRGLYYMAREWLNRKEIEKAIFYFERYIKIAPPTNELADATYVLATCYADLGDFDKAVDLLLKSASLLPTLKSPWVFLYNISHPNYKHIWKAAADAADNRGALFVRDKADELK